MSKPIVLFSFLAQVKEIYMRMRIPHFFIVMLASCMQRYETLGFGEGAEGDGDENFSCYFLPFQPTCPFFFSQTRIQSEKRNKALV